MTMTHTEFEAILRASGFDPSSARSFRPRETTPGQVTDGRLVAVQTVYPLVTVSTNENNVNNGYAPDGDAIGAVPEEISAVAIQEEQRIKATASDGFATERTPEELEAVAIEQEPRNNGVTSLVVNEANSVEEVGFCAETMPAPFYLKVDLFDNHGGKPDKKKSNRYKVKIHLAFEDGGQQLSFLGSFHPVARGFRNNVPEGYERDPFYTEIDHALDKANLRNKRWRIRPVGAKFKDENNHVMIYTAAIVFWDSVEDHPTMLLSLQGWNLEVTLDKRPSGNPGSSNLLAYGIWLNPDMRVERDVFEEKRGGKTLMETIRLQRMGLK